MLVFRYMCGSVVCRTPMRSKGNIIIIVLSVHFDRKEDLVLKVPLHMCRGA